jgi:tetratricopeptide (TPR) repeat protein
MTSQSNTSATNGLKIGRWWAALFGIIGIFILVSLLLIFVYRGLNIYKVVLVIAAVAFFPVTYLAFEVRSERNRDRLISGLALLGFGSEETARLKTLYRQIYSPQQFMLFVILASLSTLLGFGLLYFSEPTSPVMFGTQELLDPVIARTMFYAFLGAYVFSIYNVMRRFVTYDLQPGVYLNITVLIATVEVIGLVVALGFRESDMPLNFLPGQAQTVEYERWIPIVAFLIGYLPDSGIRWLSTISSRVLPSPRRRERLLAEIDGVSIWHETRLRESGIDNVQNLAATDIRKLLLTSRFSAPQVMNWVDQAILLISVPSNAIVPLREHGITTMTSLTNMIQQFGEEKMPVFNIKGLTNTDLQGIYQAVRVSSETSPNLPYVAAYWKAIKRYDTRQVEAGLEDILRDESARLANLDVSDASDAERLASLVPTLNIKAEDLERLFPNDVKSLIGLGNVYLSMGNERSYLDAERVLSEAIALDKENAPAYASRGFAYFKQDKFDLAIQDFELAEKYDPEYSWTYNNKGILYSSQEDFAKAIDALNKAIELNPTLGIAFLNRGRAYRNCDKNMNATIDLERAVELARAVQGSDVMKDAYFELGELHLEQRSFTDAISAFDQAVRLDRTNPMGYLKRGQAQLAARRFQWAVFNLITAIDILERDGATQDDNNLAISYSNLAQAYYGLDEPVDALQSAERAMELGDQRSINYKVKGLAHGKLSEPQEAIENLKIYLLKQPEASDKDAIQSVIDQLE